MSDADIDNSTKAVKKPHKKLSRFSKYCFYIGSIFRFIFRSTLFLMIVISVVQHIPKTIDNNSVRKQNNVGNKEDTILDSIQGPIPVKKTRKPIDKDTPKDAYTITSQTGEKWKLVFSDEFEEDQRTFFPGDDPYWEAVDLWYEPTQDSQYYSPDHVSTEQGKLVITVDNKPNGGLPYTSAMLQSWNKFCFKGGRVEVRVSLPGGSNASGLWPGAWLLGNLGRAGYGSTTDGVWPYSYDECDSGVEKYQNNPKLSKLPGQKLNKCVCDEEDHPSPGKGRGAPEIDIIEVSAHPGNDVISQSLQVAPFNADRQFKKSEVSLYPDFETRINGYKGSSLQQSISAVSKLPTDTHSGAKYFVFAVEYEPGENGYITWFVNGKPTWIVKADAIGADTDSKVSKRLIPEEPMYIILNLALSIDFSPISSHPKFPNYYLIDYVRVYQHPDKILDTCDPPGYPTTEYIDKHRAAYYNKNWTKWESAGYTKPKYSLTDACNKNKK